MLEVAIIATNTACAQHLLIAMPRLSGEGFVVAYAAVDGSNSDNRSTTRALFDDPSKRLASLRRYFDIKPNPLTEFQQRRGKFWLQLLMPSDNALRQVVP